MQYDGSRTFNKPYRQPPFIKTQQRQPDMYQRQHLPENEINMNLVNEFFNKVQEGELSKIKEFVITNNFSCSVLNNLGESALHATINNSSILPYAKYEISKFLIEKGAPVMSYNQANDTPLHLAAKLQEYDIIKLLLDNGANINAQNNQNMTALHYAIQGVSTECKKDDEKIKDIINVKSEDRVEDNITKISNIIINY